MRLTPRLEEEYRKDRTLAQASCVFDGQWRHAMNAPRACECILTLSLIGIGVPTQAPAAPASGSDVQSASSKSHEARKPAPPEATNRDGTMSAAPRTGKPKEAPTPPNPAQQVEERVRSGQMEQPIAQGAISERLNQLESGSNSASDHTATGHSSR